MRKKNTARRYLKIKDRSPQDRPREKLIQNGAGNLTKAELLGLVIGSGRQNINAVDLARQILRNYNNDLGALSQLSFKEFTFFEGIGEAKAALMVAVMELAKRYDKDLHKPITTIRGSKDTYRLMKPKLANKITEEFWVISLSSKKKLIRCSQISKGGLSETLVDIRVVFKECLLHNAVGIVLVHNHPSRDPSPSKADIDLTERLVKTAKTFNLHITDHVIFTDTKYFSFSDEGML